MQESFYFSSEVAKLIRNVLIGVFCMILLVTAGSFAYVGYHNTKAHIRAENEKHKAEESLAEEESSKQEPSKEKKKDEKKEEKAAGDASVRVRASDGQEDAIARLVQNMYVTPSANGDIAYQYDGEETTKGVFIEPYVVEHKDGTVTLHLSAGFRGQEAISFDRIVTKGGAGEGNFSFPQGTLKQEEQDGLAVSWYDLPATAEMETALRVISGEGKVEAGISGHEQDRRSLTQREVKHIKNVIDLYDALQE